jgi:outer membrane lipoprotein SlyB
MLLAGGAAAALAVAGAGLWFSFLQPTLQVTGVRTAQPHFVGDGKPQPVMLSFNSRNADLRAVDVRWLRGDGSWNPATWTVNLDNAGRASGELPAGALAYRATAPMSSTFEYTLVSRDGKRSAPFEHTFNIAPPMTAGPATVVSVTPITVKGQGTGAGAVVGGVAGAGLGSTIGRGNGRTAATVLGAVGGAFAGHEVEKHVRSSTLWETSVRFDDGNTRRIRHGAAPQWAAGERVVVAGDSISR